MVPLLTNGNTVPIRDAGGLLDVSRTYTHFVTAIHTASDRVPQEVVH